MVEKPPRVDASKPIADGKPNGNESHNVEALRRGGAIVFATGSDDKVKSAADIINRHGAVESEEVAGAEPQLPGVVRQSITPLHDCPVLAASQAAPVANRTAGGIAARNEKGTQSLGLHLTF